jgi:hypothetical protein
MSGIPNTGTKLVHRAGLAPWLRPFNNRRASCETDLLREFPIQSVTSWMGHSPAVALAHYAQVRDEGPRAGVARCKFRCSQERLGTDRK